MTLLELQTHPLYTLLTATEQEFVTVFVTSGGDPEKAYVESFGKGKAMDKKIVRREAKKLLVKDEIATLVDSYFYDNEPTEEEVRKYVWKSVKGAKTDTAKSSFLALYTKLRGWSKPEPSKSEVPEDKLTSILSSLE